MSNFPNFPACDTFFNFQLYTNVHTVVDVYTATGIEQHCVAMQEGDGWLLMYQFNSPVYCDSFGDVVGAAWSAMVDHLGMDAVNAIANDCRDYGVCPAAAASLAA